MAMRRNRVTKQLIEPCLRIKQRDYTIPVRLNQPLPAELVTIAAPLWRHQRHPMMMHHQEPSLQESHKMIPQTISSSKSKGGTILASFYLVATIVILATLTSTKLCHCDTQLPANINQQSSYQQSSKTKPLASPTSGGRKNAAATAISTTSQKEHLLSKLSDSIERQHFKLKPPRALIHERPSKFDSGDDDLSGGFDFGSGSNFIQKSSKPLKASVVKVDESMRQILRMHEQSGASKASAPAVQPASKRWRDISNSPMRDVLMKPNKMMTQVLSYIAPLVGSKLSDSSILGAQGSKLSPTQQAQTGTVKTKLLGLHSFVGRSNSNNHQTTSSTPQTSSMWPISIGLLRPFATVSSQTAYLARPFMGNRSSFSEFSTRPTTLVADADAGNDKSSVHNKQSGDPLADLLADSSDFSSILAPVAGMLSHFPAPSDVVQPQSSTSPSPQMDDFIKKPSVVASVETSSDGDAPKPQSVAKPQSATANKKKTSANHNNKAHSYIQNSFRDLLTLSQLPILSSSNSISTAPSILEKKNHTKPRGPKRAGASSSSSSGAGQQQDQSDPRKRFFEEVYRYLYMIGTGVRNKRDPLEALGSSPNPIALTNQKGVFSQRSINQLIAANHNQLLNYARKFRSILTAGPMSKAKPRGVMWDMATDPSLAVTVFHLLERASVALPLGFLLMPFVRMIRHPLQGLDLGRILPARASHRSVDYEELAKRLDVVDKMLSRALRPTHRESFMQ